MAQAMEGSKGVALEVVVASTMSMVQILVSNTCNTISAI